MINTKFKNWAIHQSIHHPKRTLTSALIITLVMGFGLQHFVIEDDMMKMIPKTVKSRVVWEEVKDEFGNTDLIFVAFGIEGQSLFQSSSMSDLWDFTKALEALPEVEEIRSLTNLNRMENEDGFLLIDDLVNTKDLSLEEIADIKDYLIRNPELKKRVISQNDDFFNIVVIPNGNTSEQASIVKIVATAEKLLSGYDLHFGGPPYLVGIVSSLVRADAMFLVRIGLVMMVIILLASLRSVAGVFMVLFVIILSLIGMMGSMGWIRGLTGSERFVFSIMNTSMPIILMTIANSDSVHFLTKYQLARKNDNLSAEKAVVSAFGGVGTALLVTTIILVAGFAILAQSSFGLNSAMASLTAIALFMALVADLTILPSLLILLDRKINKSNASDNVVTA